MNRNLHFTTHGMERYRERVAPIFNNIEPGLFVHNVLTHGYNFYELDKSHQKALQSIKNHSRNGNVFMVYRSFVFIFRYDYSSNTYWLITVFDIPWRMRFNYNDYTK